MTSTKCGCLALTESYSPGKGELWGWAGTWQYKSIGMAPVEEKKTGKKVTKFFVLCCGVKSSLLLVLCH